MRTQIFKMESNNINKDFVKKAGGILREGGLVAFPTETVYGLGANALMPEAVSSIFRAKGRPSDNPLIVHVTEKENILMAADSLTADAEKLIDAFSPGPLTVILKKRADLNDTVTGGLDTVAVRIPSHPIARAVIKASGVPIAAPSANLSGKPSPTRAKHVIDDMNGRIDAVIDGGICDVGVESTVIDMSGNVPTILRPGGITPDMVRQVLPDIRIDRHVTDIEASADEKVKSPGMKYKHYAPEAAVTVVEGSRKAVSEKIAQLLDLSHADGRRAGVMAMSSTRYNAELVINVGDNDAAYAKNIFTALREFDENNIDDVYAEFFETDGFALAVRNRLYRAAANKVIYL